MKKFPLFLALFSLAGIHASAQKAYEGKIKYKKVEQPAIVIEYNYPKDVVENALKAKMADLRLRAGSSKGFITYTNSVIQDITKSHLDYSFKTVESGKEKTTLYMLMEGSSSIAGDAVVLASKGKSFLEDLSQDVKRSNTIIQIKKKEDALVTEEQKLKKLKEDYLSLEEKLKSNQEEQNKQSQIIASQKSMLNDLKTGQ